MENLRTFLVNYKFILILILILVLYAACEWQSFKAKLYSLMLLAKSLAKDAVLKSGDEQVKWVVDKAYVFLPKRITIFISEGMMEKIVFYLYHKAKDYLDDGKINGSVQA
ncbi:hypothetical protein IAI10_14315 [Clostridium sp. 19966]|uniref:hypothetical protein n=1 Tax=Clostridium sp. 19966 TaxID=2768166 RepID=UPI0028DD62D8|nr:hypothetical protein [Clostridium sp. 19966]MDT8717839.1 hypothetical protein [Clostridium sp. 19966]